MSAALLCNCPIRTNLPQERERLVDAYMQLTAVQRAKVLYGLEHLATSNELLAVLDEPDKEIVRSETPWAGYWFDDTTPPAVPKFAELVQLPKDKKST
jgi:hypothetical protein